MYTLIGHQMHLLDDIEAWIMSGAWVFLEPEDQQNYRLELQDFARDFHCDSDVHLRAQRILQEHDIRYHKIQHEEVTEERR